MHALTHAGGVVVRRGAGDPEYLIVRPSSGADEWVLPKGHIEPGETPERAAVREVAEEAGVHADVVREIGRFEFTSKGEQARVAFFVMRWIGDGRATEEREIRWLPYDEAHASLTHSGSRAMLERARAVEG